MPGSSFPNLSTTHSRYSVRRAEISRSHSPTLTAIVPTAPGQIFGNGDRQERKNPTEEPQLPCSFSECKSRRLLLRDHWLQLLTVFHRIDRIPRFQLPDHAQHRGYMSRFCPDHAMISCTTFPATSVRRNGRPVVLEGEPFRGRAP